MDTVQVNIKTAIQQLFQQYVEFLSNSEDTQFETIIDPENQRYLLVEIGWKKGHRIYGTLIHIDVIDNKLWIQQDGTEEGIADELVSLGIPQDQIVLGFKPLERRQLTEFAVN